MAAMSKQQHEYASRQMYCIKQKTHGLLLQRTKIPPNPFKSGDLLAELEGRSERSIMSLLKWCVTEHHRLSEERMMMKIIGKEEMKKRYRAGGHMPELNDAHDRLNAMHDSTMDKLVLGDTTGANRVELIEDFKKFCDDLIDGLPENPYLQDGDDSA